VSFFVTLSSVLIPLVSGMKLTEVDGTFWLGILKPQLQTLVAVLAGFAIAVVIRPPASDS
jgi:hypothetical protein